MSLLKISLILCLALSACSWPPTYITKHGVRVWTKGLTIPQEEVEAVHDFMLEQLPQLSRVGEDEILHSLDGSFLFFYKARENMKYAGRNAERWMRVAWFGSMCPQSALVHETIHLIQWRAYFEIDYFHDSYLWDVQRLIWNKYCNG